MYSSVHWSGYAYICLEKRALPWIAILNKRVSKAISLNLIFTIAVYGGTSDITVITIRNRLGILNTGLVSLYFHFSNALEKSMNPSLPRSLAIGKTVELFRSMRRKSSKFKNREVENKWNMNSKWETESISFTSAQKLIQNEYANVFFGSIDILFKMPI